MAHSILPTDPNKVMHSLIDDGVPEVLLVGGNNVVSANAALPDHVHPGTMEIHYLVSGQLTWSVGGKIYIQRGNEVFVTWPDEVHGMGADAVEKCFFYWVQIILPPSPRSFLRLDAQQSALLVDGLRNLPCRHFSGRHEIGTWMHEILQLHVLAQRQNDLNTLAIIHRVQSILLTVIECSRNKQAGQCNPDIQDVIERIRNNPREQLYPADLAESIDLSLSRFHHKFKEQTGQPPAEFILRNKIEFARRQLLETDLPITRIAVELGFSSSQYFAQVFKRFTHATPRDVRRKALQPAARGGKPSELRGR